MIRIVLAAAAALMLLACSSTPPSTAQHLTGTVQHVDLEGGFYGIVTSTGEKLYPLNLPVEFKQDGVKISFDAVYTDQPTVAMWGRSVQVSNVKRGT